METNSPIFSPNSKYKITTFFILLLADSFKNNLKKKLMKLQSRYVGT